MKIELKSIKFSEAMSEETNAFTANLYINGKKVGKCKNTGQGGCTDYNADSPELRPVIAKAEAYCRGLPKTKWKTMEFDQSLESVIDQSLEDWLKAKDKKKLEHKMKKAILVGVPDGDSYTMFKYNITLDLVPKKIMKTHLETIKEKHCTDGKVILNTNLIDLGITV